MQGKLSREEMRNILAGDEGNPCTDSCAQIPIAPLIGIVVQVRAALLYLKVVLNTHSLQGLVIPR